MARATSIFTPKDNLRQGNKISGSNRGFLHFPAFSTWNLRKFEVGGQILRISAKRSLQVEVCSVHRTRRSNSCFAQNRFEAWCECITAGRDSGMLKSYLSPFEAIWKLFVEPCWATVHIFSYLFISSLLASSLQGLDKRVSRMHAVEGTM